MQIANDKPKISKYVNLRNSLAEAIESGQYQKDSRLPTQQDLARQFNVSMITVRQALELLEREGRISQEHGRGTFVRSIESKETAFGAGKKSIAYVLADQSWDDYSFHNDVIKTLTCVLEEQNQYLTVSGLTTPDILQGKLPAALRHGSVSGVILSHFVQDIHVEFLKRQELPLVVMGNYPLRVSVPNVCCDIEQAGYLMSKALLEQNKGPLYIVTEAFELHYTHELYAGYARACREKGQEEHLCTVSLVSEKNNTGEEFRKIIEANKGPFSILLHCNIGHVLMDVYKGYRLDLQDHPVAIFGAADYVPPEICRQLNQCGHDTPYMVQVALDVLNRVIAGEKIEKVVLEPKLTTSEVNGLFRMELNWK
jgi:DNA-binding LacI/PurR family transcriptional regulator